MRPYKSLLVYSDTSDHSDLSDLSDTSDTSDPLHYAAIP